MTDEQIIKNAEHHKLGNCSQCDYKNYGSNCLHELLNDSIKMAKRLCDDVADFEETRAEIKELKDILEKVPTNAYDLQVEASEKLENQIKSEAIKEFAERLCKGRVENDPVVIATKAELDYVLGVGLEVQK